MLTIVLDHVACMHAQFGISVMAEAADIAGWFLLVFCFCHVAKHCEEMNFLNTFREIDYLFDYLSNNMICTVTLQLCII